MFLKELKNTYIIHNIQYIGYTEELVENTNSKKRSRWIIVLNYPVTMDMISVLLPKPPHEKALDKMFEGHPISGPILELLQIAAQ